MFGSLGQFKDMMKMAKDFQGNLSRLQSEMAQARYEGVAGGEMVRAIVDGRGQLVDIKIDPKAAGDVELLEDLVKAAIGAASTKAQDGMKEQMAAMTGGLDLSAFGGLLGGR